MYKLVLCLRYLRTRRIALVSIVSVTLGVATMIVVNAVMAGFVHEMQDRIHGVLSDVALEARSLDGVADPERHMARIRAAAGDMIAGMSPTAVVPAALGYSLGEQYINQPVTVIGVDPATYGQVSDFGRFLQHPENRKQLSFDLRKDGYDTIDHQAEDPSRVRPRKVMESAGWEHRRRKALWNQQNAELARARAEATRANDPFAGLDTRPEGETFDPATEQHAGVVIGIALGSQRDADGTDRFFVLPGDDVEVMYPSASRPPKPLSAKFTVVDFYESKMSEYDGTFVFVPIRKLQELRGLIDPATGVGNFNSIQIRCAEGVDPERLKEKIQAAFDPRLYVVSTWRDKQGALLAAVQMETAVLNVLLFLIIAVAGFGILAIFYMVVVEKTRDIGILKSLGASGGGVMEVFLGFGLALGLVGVGAGVVGGLLFVEYINEIADLIARVTGRPVFDPSIYYFSKIPAIVDPLTVVAISIGSVAIAVLASIAPAWRASSLHPVEALRWE